jgi:hypothetical protein
VRAYCAALPRTQSSGDVGGFPRPRTAACGCGEFVLRGAGGGASSALPRGVGPYTRNLVYGASHGTPGKSGGLW